MINRLREKDWTAGRLDSMGQRYYTGLPDPVRKRGIVYSATVFF
jgi:hypothetical protein